MKGSKYLYVADLSLDWDGNAVWMNPPYGREIIKWVKKASESETTVV